MSADIGPTLLTLGSSNDGTSSNITFGDTERTLPPISMQSEPHGPLLSAPSYRNYTNTEVNQFGLTNMSGRPSSEYSTQDNSFSPIAPSGTSTFNNFGAVPYNNSAGHEPYSAFMSSMDGSHQDTTTSYTGTSSSSCLRGHGDGFLQLEGGSYQANIGGGHRGRHAITSNSMSMSRFVEPQQHSPTGVDDIRHARSPQLPPTGMNDNSGCYEPDGMGGD